MDERQAQITEGAGLEESRVNEDLIAFLNKWSFPVLLIIALVSGGYYLYNMYEQARLAKRDAAFAELGNVESAPNPSVFSLTSIAEEFDGVGSVSELALLQAADIHLNAVRTGIDPADGETALAEEDRAFHLEQAKSLYQQVADRVTGSADRGLFAVNAAFGLAATAESSGDLELAKSKYSDAESLATEAGFASLAKVAAEFGASVGAGDPLELYEADALPRMPFEPEPVTESDTENEAGASESVVDSLETTIEVIDDGEVTPEIPTEPTESPADPAGDPAVDPEDG